jgi:small-conductance mechanosensitive channel
MIQRTQRTFRAVLIGTALSLLLTVITGAGNAFAQAAPGAINQDPLRWAPVVIDGRTLFKLRGVTALPARERADRVRENIIAAARDTGVSVDDLRTVEDGELTRIFAGGMPLVAIADIDAEAEGVSRSILAEIYKRRIAETITTYREDRSTAELTRNSLFALGATVLAALLFWGMRALFNALVRWTERRVQRGVDQLASKAHHLIQARQMWGVIGGLLRLLRILAYLLLAYSYLNTVLGLFPWTRPAARVLFRLILDPLESIWLGFVGSLPNLAFLVVLWFVVRYILKLIRAFFRGVERGRIKLENFDADWASPTYKIVRFSVIAFAIVIAYPYIPGSDSLAFKGVSVFVGVLLSLGSSSFISNAIAGLTMTYRRAFKEGERIQVGDIVGIVEDIKPMATKVRTAKNELVTVPNSTILNQEVINYSQLAREEGVILHTIVGIGYDTPWRQVEAMLKLAADRTEGLLQDPPPFVLQRSLGDYAVNYELNAYTCDEKRMLRLYSALHANIQDVFNEHGVQIMSPSYEADPETPKIVPPAKWYEAPAKKPTS